MRRFICSDIEWPSEVVEPSVTTSDVERILDNLNLTFSPESKRDTLKWLRQYPLDIYNEKNNPQKNEQRKAIKDLRSSITELQKRLFAFTRTDPGPSSSEIYNTIAILSQLSVRNTEA